MAEISKEKIVKLAKEIADRLGQDFLSRPDFVKETGISNDTIYKFFPDGGWAEVCKKAGLKTKGAGYPIEKGKLLEEFHRVVSEMGKIPNRNQLTARSKYHEGTFRKRFNGLKNLKKEYCDWLINNVPESPLIEILQTESKHDPKLPLSGEEASSKQIHQPIDDKTEFGAPMSFRGFTHAPINEQGVVYLFGMVSHELGFRVEAIQSSFPDCEAKRRVDKKRDRWKRVRIEFEYSSRNFHKHGHDPSQCDLIVCWQHDWPECPLEVLELRSTIDELNDKA